MFKRERSWAEQDRREHRVGNWRGFVKGGKRRKEVDAHGWKEERRVRAARLLSICLMSEWQLMCIWLWSIAPVQDDKTVGGGESEAYKKNWK